VLIAGTCWISIADVFADYFGHGKAAHAVMDGAFVVALTTSVWVIDRRAILIRQEAARREREASLELARRLARAAELHDHETGQHADRIGPLAREVARELGLSPQRCDILGQAAVLHDVGKIGVDRCVLQKRGPLSPQERAEVERHPAFGSALLAGTGHPVLTLGRVVAMTHHERWDGTGYPLGLRGEQIPIEGRIVAVCDMLDALVSDRPYREAMTLEDALEIVAEGRGTRFDPQVVDALIACRPYLEAAYRTYGNYPLPDSLVSS